MQKHWLVQRLTLSIATQNDTRSTPLDAFGPRGERGELIVVGQVAMVTYHGGRRTMPTGDAGSPIGGRSLVTQEEAVTGPWTVRPLHGPPRDAGGADKERERGARFYSQTTAQSTT